MHKCLVEKKTTFVFILVGQCGNQIGGAFWPLVLQEYGINDIPGIKSNKKSRNINIHQSFSTFFHVPDGKLDDVSSFIDLKLSKVKARVNWGNVKNIGCLFVYFRLY